MLRMLPRNVAENLNNNYFLRSNNFLNQMKKMWHLWALALGEKAHKKDDVADRVAIVRTIIFTTYLITNCFIIAGVVRHWNSRTINVEVEIYENPSNNQNTYSERRNYLGVARNTRIESFHCPATVNYSSGGFE
jgi:hypothetical protein